MNQPAKSPKVFIWLLTLTACSGNVGNTIISPALGPVSKYFGIDEASSQALLSAYYLPMALFPLVFGSLSDRYGRRPPLIFGLVLLTAGGFTATLSESFELLVFARVLQGIGAAAAGTILIPMIKDSYGSLEAARILAIVSSIMMIVPFFSFAFGGIITEIFSWKGTMFVIFLFGFISLINNFWLLSESNTQPAKEINLISLTKDYSSLITNRMYMALMLSTSFTVGIWLSMLGFVPFEYQRIGIDSVEIGLWFMTVPMGFLVGNHLTKTYVHKIGIENFSLIGSFTTLLIMITFLLPNILGWKHEMLIGIPCLIFGISSAVLLTTASMGAVAAAGELGGSASGLMKSTQTFFGVIGGSLVVGIGGFENFEKGVFVLIGFALLAAICSSLAKTFRADLSSSSP